MSCFRRMTRTRFSTACRVRDPMWSCQARATQEPREGVDYAAARVSAEEAGRIVAIAERFVSAVGELIDRS